MNEAVENRELGWDDTISKDAQEFIVIPEGDYDFVIDHFERSRSKGGGKLPPCNMVVVYFNITAPDGEEVQIRENYILHQRVEWKLSELFVGVGLKQKGQNYRMEWDRLPGMTGRCKVIIETDRNDPQKKYNHIKSIYPYTPNTAPTGGFKKWN